MTAIAFGRRDRVINHPDYLDPFRQKPDGRIGVGGRPHRETSAAAAAAFRFSFSATSVRTTSAAHARLVHSFVLKTCPADGAVQ